MSQSRPNDRFIRTNVNLELANWKLGKENSPLLNLIGSNGAIDLDYEDALSKVMFGLSKSQLEALPVVSTYFSKTNHNAFETSQSSLNTPKYNFKIEALRTLDAPGIVDDYYSHPLSCTDSLFGIALGRDFHCQNFQTKATIQLPNPEYTDTPDYFISSLSASPFSTKWVAGTSHGCIELYDPYAGSLINACFILPRRLAAIQPYSGNTYFIGSQNSAIYLFDDRTLTATQAASFNSAGEVCGLSFNGEWLLASGYNGNLVCVWDIRNLSHPTLQNSLHKSAVKALQFSPFDPSIIATGGGIADKKVCIWNAKTGQIHGQLKAVGVELSNSITSVQWSPIDSKELVVTSGLDISVWRSTLQHSLLFSGSKRAAVVMGAHENRYAEPMSRILDAKLLLPNGDQLVTVSAKDEALKFWDMKSSERFREKNRQASSTKGSTKSIMELPSIR